MSLSPINDTPGSADNAPQGADKLNQWLAQIQTNQANIATNSSAIGGLNSSVSVLQTQVGSGSTSANSVTGAGLVTSPLTLVNDSSAPGANKVYGTDGSGNRGWQTGVSSSVLSAASITGTGSGSSPVQLVNDVTLPGNSFLYGTSSSGVKGWQPITGNAGLQNQISALVPQFGGASPPSGAPNPITYGYVLQWIDPRSASALASTFDPTGATDQGPLLTQCCADGRTAGGVNGPIPVKWPGGTFLFTTMATCNAAGTNTGRSSFHLTGAGTTYTSALETYGSATRFVSTNGAAPVISANNVYGSTIEKIGFYGANTAPNNQGLGGSNGYPIDTQSLYVTSGCRSDTYSPYCAIVIDGFNVATAPTGGGYPGQAYNQNAGEGSSQVTVRDCAFSFFVVGIALSPAGGGVQCDNIKFINNQVGGCDTLYALCCPNSHEVVIERGYWASFRTGVDTVSWGGGLYSASPPQLKDLQINYGYRIFNCASSAGALVLDNVYAETMRSIGQFGGGGSTFRSPLYFKGGSMNLGTSYGAFTVPLPPLVLERYGPTYSIGTQWTVDKGLTNIDAFNIGGSGGCAPMIFMGCTLPGSPIAGQPPFIATPFNQNFDTAIVENCWVTSGSSGYYLSDNGSRLQSFNTVTPSFGRKVLTWNTRAVPVGNVDYTYIPANATPGVSIAVSSLTLVTSGGTFNTGSVNKATFTYTGALLQIGDIIPWRYVTQGTSVTQEIRAGLKVSNISGTSITATLLWDAIEYDGTYAPSTLQILQHQWAPTQAVTCTVTGTDNTFSTISSTTTLKAGDWLAQVPGLPANTRVATISGTTGTFNNTTTLSGTVSLTGTGNLCKSTPRAAFAPSTDFTWNTQAGNYTLSNAVDVGNGVIMSGNTLTVPSYGAGTTTNFLAPTVIPVINSSGSSTTTIAAGTGGGTVTLQLAGGTTTGSRTLAAGAQAVLTLLSISQTTGNAIWLVSGAGVT
jgi:hypothetical protein